MFISPADLGIPVRVDGECWIALTSEVGDTGYRKIKRNGKTYRVHRWVYEQFVSPIPDGLVIDHLCRVKACIRPDHLEAVTISENTRRGRSPEITRARNIANRKPFCGRGHLMEEDNLYRWKERRSCWTCRKEKELEYYYRVGKNRRRERRGATSS